MPRICKRLELPPPKSHLNYRGLQKFDAIHLDVVEKHPLRAIVEDVIEANDVGPGAILARDRLTKSADASTS